MITNKNRLSKLIEDLQHPDSSKRRAAAEALADADERAIYPLIKALRDENSGVQDAAMRSLMAIGGEIVAYMAVPLLREESLLRNTALLILRSLGCAAVPLLYPLLKDKDDDVRKFSLDLLGEIVEDVSPEKVVPLLCDPNPNARAAAAKTLGSLMYREAAPELIEALKDEEWVCFSVLEALGRLNDERAIVPITGLLSSESGTLRYAAIETLGVMGSPLSSNALLAHMTKAEGFEKIAVVKSLVSIGLTPSMFEYLSSGTKVSIPEIADILIDMFKNSEWDDRLIALRGLVALKDEKAISTIIDLAGMLDPSEPESEERLFIIKDALQNFGCSNVFIDILNDPAIKFRGKVITIDIVGKIKFKKAVPQLIKLIESNLRDVRRAGIRALGEIAASGEAPEDGENINSSLLTAVDDYDSHVRKAAITALGDIGERSAYGPIMDLLKVEKYQDVIEEAVRSLMNIDFALFLSNIDKLDDRVREIALWYKERTQ
jgi:HEAT repeat protein